MQVLYRIVGCLSRTLAWQGVGRATRVGFPLGDDGSNDIYDAFTRIRRGILFLDKLVEVVVESTVTNTTADNSTIVNIAMLSMLHRITNVEYCLIVSWRHVLSDSACWLLAAGGGIGYHVIISWSWSAISIADFFAKNLRRI